MKCEDFRSAADFSAPQALEHLRSCDLCLNFAAEQDGDVLFRSLGGDDMVPPGGIDAFVGDVMREVQLRDKQRLWTARGRVSPWSRWSAAAAIVVATLAYVAGHRPMPHVAAPTQIAATRSAPTVSRPVIESYDSGNATIVEVPSEANDAKIVMVFDETLPADL